MKRDMFIMANRTLNDRVKATKLGKGEVVGNVNAIGRSFNSALAVGTAAKVYDVGNRACSAGLRGGWLQGKLLDDKESAEFITSATLTGKLKTARVSYEDMTKFMDWFINRSPWSICIVTNSAKVAMEKGIVFDAHYPANLIAGGTMVHRCLWEYYQLIRTWKLFTDAGMNENAAFFMAHGYEEERGTLSKCCYDVHCALDGDYLDPDTLRNFVAGDIKSPDKTFNERFGYGQVASMWVDPNKNRDRRPDYIKLATQGIKLPKDAVPVVNPFKGLRLRARMALPLDVTVKALATYINETVLGENHA